MKNFKKAIHRRFLGIGALLTTRFCAERRQVRERLTNIMDGRRKSAGVPLICAILLCSLLSGLIVSCYPQSEIPDEPTPDTSVSPLTAAEVESLYENARPLAMRFYGSSASNGGEQRKYRYQTYENDTEFGTMEALQNALSQVFTEAMTEEFLNLNLFMEQDDRLWELTRDIGSDIRCGDHVAYVITAFTADTVSVNRIVDVEDIVTHEDGTFAQTKIGESIQTLTLVNQNGRWLFASFPRPDDLSEYDSRTETAEPIPAITDLETLFASIPEGGYIDLYSGESYIEAADLVLHPDAHRDELDDDYYALYSSMNITDYAYSYSSATRTIYLSVKIDGEAPVGLQRGWNTFPFSVSLMGIYIDFSTATSSLFEAEEIFAGYQNGVWLTDLPKSKSDLKDYDLVVFGEYIISKLEAQGDRHITLADFQSYAEKCFGIADLVPAAQNYDAETDTCYLSGHGGNHIAYRIRDVWEDDGIYTLNIQYFADFGYQLPSHLVSYRMQKDGNDWVFLSSERLTTADREPARHAT